MVQNYLKIAWRTLWRNKGYTFVNVAGLSVGMAACILILLYVQDESSYDTYHAHADRVFRITQEQFDIGGAPGVHRVMVDPPVAPLLKSTFPEVTHAARLTPVGPSLQYGDHYVGSGACYWADPDLFDIFSIPFVAGNPRTALTEPFSLVLSASKAQALFGEENPLGKTVIVNEQEAFQVTGVFEDLPANTHLPIDVLGSMATMESWFGPLGWDSPNYVTYIRLADGVDAEAFARKLPGFLADQRGEEAARLNRFHLQALPDIHLHSHLVGELVPNGDIRYVYLFSVVALFILLIACINFTNLSTARSMRRAREVGIRKMAGARRIELIRQFLGESVLLAFVSLVISLMLVETALPFFNAFTGKMLGFRVQDGPEYLAVLVGIGVAVGIAAGSYPAFFLSAFRPITVLKDAFHRRSGRSIFRATLVVTQFVIAIVLLISTFAVYQQRSYISKRNLGFDKEHVLILPTVWDIKEHFDPFREQLLRHPDVIDVGQSNPVPSRRLMWSVEAGTQHDSSAPATTATLYPVFADAHFFPTYHVPFVAGRNFSDEVASDADTGFILNESAAKKLGWALPGEAVGEPLRVGGWRGSVLGVVKDFHFESLHQEIAPMVFYMDPRNYRQVSIRIRPGSDLAGLVHFLEGKWQEYEPNSPLSYEFLDDSFGAVYEAERKLGQLFGVFAVLAVVITCLGVFGMTAFSVEQRTKEVGIRKILGATVTSIVLLFSRDFLKLLVIAFVVATPIGVFAMRRWLDTFAYHAELGWWIFALTGLAALLIVVLTVSYQAVKAGMANPVKSLRYE